MITQELLKERYHYDPLTGVFTNRKRLSPVAPEGAVAGCTENNGYRSISIHGKMYRLHRLIWLYVYGKLPDGNIDHINRIRDDNRLSNLRDVPQSTNTHNKEPGKKGCKKTKSGRYNAVIKINNKQVYLGTYDTQEEAHAAYLTKKLELQRI